jgi:hypothetical protein
MNDIGIAIIDVYEQENLNSCYDSIPKENSNIIIVSNTKNKLPNCETKKYATFTPFATLRNWAINHFRLKEIKHIFLINSNQVIKDPKIFENTINTANTFGIWFFCGPFDSKTTIEDDEKNITLNLSENINSDFIYIFNNIVSKIGFFEERYFNTKSLDVLDYILKMRDKKIYPPTGYISTIQNGIETTTGNITKPDYEELGLNSSRSVNMSYAYFLATHKYIPTQNDPKPASNEELMKELEELQKNYANKL